MGRMSPKVGGTKDSPGPLGKVLVVEFRSVAGKSAPRVEPQSGVGWAGVPGAPCPYPAMTLGGHLQHLLPGSL